MPRITRRLGRAPRDRGCHSNATCPDLFELADGRIAVIGTRVDHTTLNLPGDAGVAPHEAVVVIPRDVLVHAVHDLPDA